MLGEDGSTVRLLADPRRAAGAVRLYSVLTLVGGLVAAASLLSGVAVLLVPTLLTTTTLSSTPVGNLRWLAVGFAFCALVFGALTAWFAAAGRRARRFAAQGFLVGLDPGGITLPDQAPDRARIDYPAIAQVTVRWARVQHPRPVGAGGRIGRRLGQEISTQAGQDEMIRQLTVTVHVGDPVTTFAPAMATDGDFAAFLDHLAPHLHRRGIPLVVVRT